MKTAPLGKLITITIGKTPPRGDHTFWDRDKTGKNAWLSIRDLQTLDSRKALDSSEYISNKGAKLFKPVSKGTLLVSFKLTLGRLAFAGRDIYTNEAIAALRNDEKTVTNEYLYYYLSYFDWYKYAKSDMKVKGLTLNKAKLSVLPVSFPEAIDEQRRVVKILDAAFEKIDQAIELTGLNIKNVRKLYDATFQSLMNDSSGTKVILSDACEISTKLVDPKEEPYLTQIHIGAANIETGTGKLIDLKTAQEEKLISGKFPFDENTILYSKIRPYLKKVARPNFSGLCSADIYPLTPREDRLNRDFLFYLLLSPDFTQYAVSGSDRAGMPKVNRPHLFKYCFNLPPLRQQEQIVAALNKLSHETQELRSLYKERSKTLLVLKKSFLHKAFEADCKI